MCAIHEAIIARAVHLIYRLPRYFIRGMHEYFQRLLVTRAGESRHGYTQVERLRPEFRCTGEDTHTKLTTREDSVQIAGVSILRVYTGALDLPNTTRTGANSIVGPQCNAAFSNFLIGAPAHQEWQSSRQKQSARPGFS